MNKFYPTQKVSFRENGKWKPAKIEAVWWCQESEAMRYEISLTGRGLTWMEKIRPTGVTEEHLRER